jgi:regulator of replication initiation timing
LLVWDKIGGLFDSYFDHLKGLNTKKESVRIVGIIQNEVSAHLQELLHENEKLRLEIDRFNAK